MSETFTRDDMARAVEKEHRRHCRKTHYEAVYGNASSNTKWCDWVNPYATPALPPEPPEGTIVVDRKGQAWQRLSNGWCDTVDGQKEVDYGWEELVATYGPLRVAVPLTDEERVDLARMVRQEARGHYDPTKPLDLASRIEGTLP